VTPVDVRLPEEKKSGRRGELLKGCHPTQEELALHRFFGGDRPKKRFGTQGEGKARQQNKKPMCKARGKKRMRGVGKGRGQGVVGKMSVWGKSPSRATEAHCSVLDGKKKGWNE